MTETRAERKPTQRKWRHIERTCVARDRRHLLSLRIKRASFHWRVDFDEPKYCFFFFFHQSSVILKCILILELFMNIYSFLSFLNYPDIEIFWWYDTFFPILISAHYGVCKSCFTFPKNFKNKYECPFMFYLSKFIIIFVSFSAPVSYNHFQPITVLALYLLLKSRASSGKNKSIHIM